jgi:hypothetical protein
MTREQTSQEWVLRVSRSRQVKNGCCGSAEAVKQVLEAALVDGCDCQAKTSIKLLTVRLFSARGERGGDKEQHGIRDSTRRDRDCHISMSHGHTPRIACLGSLLGQKSVIILCCFFSKRGLDTRGDSRSFRNAVERGDSRSFGYACGVDSHGRDDKLHKDLLGQALNRRRVVNSEHSLEMGCCVQGEPLMYRLLGNNLQVSSHVTRRQIRGK